MALTTNKKNKIIAEWKAGDFKSYNAVATHYKIDPKTVKKILDGIEQSNSHIVEAGVMLETLKKSIKNPNEIKAIENSIQNGYDRAVKADEYKKKVDDIQLDLLDGIRTLLDKGTISRPMKIKNGDFDVIEQVEHDFTPNDYKTLINAVDDAAKTIGAVERGTGKIEVNNQNNQQNNIITVEIE